MKDGQKKSGPSLSLDQSARLRIRRLSKHFTLGELTVSETAIRLGLDNFPDKKHMAALTATALGLEQIRHLFGSIPVIVTSAYRSPKVNAAVGGTATSDHAIGWAADIRIPPHGPLEVSSRIAESSIMFDQLIYEPSRNITHISFNPRLRRQLLTQKLGPGTPIIKGIVA